MKARKASPILMGAALALVVVAGCGAPSGGGEAKGRTEKAQKAYEPRIESADFTSRIDNKYFPLKPGTTFVYKGEFHGTAERDVMAVTDDTKRVMGVECLVASDRVTEGGELVEQTYDWYAQDKEGNVWYFGEDVTEYKNGKVTGHEGSWEPGVDGARHRHESRSQGRADLPPGVLQRGRGRQSQGRKPEWVRRGALRQIRPRARDRRVHSARAGRGRTPVLRRRGWRYCRGHGERPAGADRTGQRQARLRCGRRTVE